MMSIRKNERIEFNPQAYLLGYTVKRYKKQPESPGLLRQWAIRN